MCSRLFHSNTDAHLPQLTHLTADHVRTFRANGWVVVDGFLGAATARQLREEAASLHDKGGGQADQSGTTHFDYSCANIPEGPTCIAGVPPRHVEQCLMYISPVICRLRYIKTCYVQAWVPPV